MGIIDTIGNFLLGKEPISANLGWGNQVGNAPGAVLPFELRATTQTVKDIRAWAKNPQSYKCDGGNQ